MLVHRPGVFYTIKMDGCLDVWDYFYKQNDPTLQVGPSCTELTSEAAVLRCKRMPAYSAALLQKPVTWTVRKDMSHLYQTNAYAVVLPTILPSDSDTVCGFLFFLQLGSASPALIHSWAGSTSCMVICCSLTSSSLLWCDGNLRLLLGLYMSAMLQTFFTVTTTPRCKLTAGAGQ